MTFTRGNLALLNHVRDGKRVFLFEQTTKGNVQFISELTFFNFDYYPTLDTAGNNRIGIKFFFKSTGAIVNYELDKTDFLAAESNPDYFLPSITERAGLVLSRVGQGAYRKSIINRWENKCAVTGYQDPRILIASHIHPWKDASNDERLDVNNGILLSPTYDALFDKHLITFDSSGKIILSEAITLTEYNKIGVSGFERITKLNSDNIGYLEKHHIKFSNNFS